MYSPAGLLLPGRRQGREALWVMMYSPDGLLGADNNTRGISEQWMMGDALLVSPILYQGATSARAYFPQGTWYGTLPTNPLLIIASALMTPDVRELLLWLSAAQVRLLLRARHRCQRGWGVPDCAGAVPLVCHMCWALFVDLMCRPCPHGPVAIAPHPEQGQRNSIGVGRSITDAGASSCMQA